MAEKQYVAFRLEDQTYGAAIDVVREVTYATHVTRLPNTPPYVDGVIDLRGEVLPVLNLRKRLGLEPRETDKDTRLMVLSLGERSCALVVDGVESVLTFEDEAITPPPADLTVPGQDYVTGVGRLGERLIIILDVARMLG